MKKILMLLVVFASALALAACGGERLVNREKIVEWYELSEDANYNGEAVTITFWHRMGAAGQQRVVKWIEEFREIYPNITVIQEKPASDYNALADRISLAIAAGNQPDIAESYPDHIARYAQGNAPLALNYFISNPNIGFSDEEIADFLPGLWSEGSAYDNAGSIMSLPFTKSSEALFYNKAYFEQNGYTVPSTWEELFAIAEDIKSKEQNTIPFGYDSEDNLFITASEQYGAPYTGFSDETGRGEVLFNNTQSQDMVKYFKDKVDRGLMITRGLNNEAYTSDIFKATPMDKNADGYADANKLYMYVGSTGGSSYAINDESFGNGVEVGVAPLPTFEGKKQAQIQQGPNVNLFNSGNELKMIASWLFVKYMTSDEKTAEFALASGYAPIRYSAYDTATWLDYVASIKEQPANVGEAAAKVVKEAIEIFLENGDVFFTSAVFDLSSKTRTEVGNLLLKILAYESTSQADLDRYIREQYQDSYDFIVN